MTANGVTTFVWSEATAHGKVTPQFVDSYDSATGTLAPAQLLMATPPAKRSARQAGHLHGQPGLPARGVRRPRREILYSHSLAPYTIAAGWTLPVPVCTDGYIAADGTERASQTYCAFVCDSQDVLHLITRQFRRGVDAYFGGKLYGALVHQACPPGGVWGAPTIIVVPSEPGYAVFYHKLALDHRDRLFLSCSSSGGQERIDAQQRGALLSVLGRSSPQLGKYLRRMLLVSDDDGASWRLAGDADLAAPSQAAPVTREPVRRTPAGSAPDANSAWSWLRGPAAGNQLTDISMANARSGWAVGTHGTVLRTDDGGAHWNRQDPGTTADLLGVAATDASCAWAVGEGGLVLRTLDGGLTWRALPTGTANTLFAVAARSAQRAWAVGGGDGAVMLTTDGGHSWTKQRSLTHENLYAVDFLNGKRGWLCGGDGRVRTTSDGGRQWYGQQSVTHVPLYGLCFADAAHGVAVGNGGTTQHTSDGGRTWHLRAVAGSPNLRNVCLVSAATAYASGAGGTLLSSADGGRAWTRLAVPLSGMCGALAAAPGGSVWTGGEGGLPCGSRDGGHRWTPVPAGASVSLRAAAADGSTLALAGSHDTLLWRDDAGALDPVSLPAAADFPATSAVALAGDETWVAGAHGVVLHRTGADAPWQQSTAGSADLAALAAPGRRRGVGGRGRRQPALQQRRRRHVERARRDRRRPRRPGFQRRPARLGGRGQRPTARVTPWCCAPPTAARPGSPRTCPCGAACAACR